MEQTDAADALKPALVSGYTVLSSIGQGGQARVYLAERDSDGLRVALKILEPRLRANSVFLERFVREYQLIASLQCEHVARIYDQGISGELPYIAMEFLPSGTLAARIHEGLSSRAALRIASQIARALDAIHSRGIVHRDLKPANILFRPDGAPVIVDFGLARDLGADSSLTALHGLIATPRYMSPEQCRGEAVDARSDLYSLGVIFYEMLTGRKIFDTENPARLAQLHMNAPLPQLPERLAGYQPILDRLLAKKPADRFQSARELFALIAI
ncbi:MAG TPA: serine/threonine-protein kinase [Burkholderiales bacterium]|nr:serine/threonine-protein kinase [Burkholderiales bacterium]